MKSILNHLFNFKKLDAAEARQVLVNIAQNKYNNSQIAAFLSVFLMRAITVEELQGFRDALLALCIPIDFSDYETIDLCGTGGDGKNTFNVSTLASFVVAGAGYKVAKHGNYGVSSACGSSNMLEYLGYQFTNDEPTLKRQLEDSNICFLHAPLFHPAMKNVAPIRRELGIKTFFNMLGPLVNPSQPKHQIVGVFSLELARLYQYLHQKTSKQYTIVHSLDGYDEISLTGAFKKITNAGEAILHPENIGFSRLKQEELYGGDTVKSAAAIFQKIIAGKGTKAQNEVVTVNAAMAIQTLRPRAAFADCVEEASESLLAGKAQNALKKLLELSEKKELSMA